VPAPTSYLGYVDDLGWMGSILADASEQIPDLIWPASVNTYAQMRRDPQLAAVLKAVTLPIRRATWQVDPAGASPEAVQLVADGLGLAVKDATADRPTGARVRGVRWSEHCRLSLLNLVFGHMAFEETYDVSDGRTAKLAALSERMPSTVQSIEVNPDGTLDQIRQYGQPQGRNSPIPASRLLWYAHEREGSAWQGTSMLRPGYAPWLLKREMLRAHATGNRRFNHGVPTVEWSPGADPTPVQIADAAAFASAARAGDQSGGSLPPGAHLVLTGLTGGVPDTLGFVRYLDQQMSRLALAGMLDLGETPNGSRALGAEFVDLFLLTIQALADEQAETLTAQTAARIVAYNFGDDQPVPYVCVADVGSKREVTVEAIQALISSGAVEPDPALDAWIRREWRLPERVTPWVAPVQRAPSSSGSAVSPGVTPAEPAPAKPEPAPAEYVAAAAGHRPLTAVEAAAGLDPAAVQQDWQTALDTLTADWVQVDAGWQEQILAAVGDAVTGGDLSGLPQTAVDTSAAAQLLTAALDSAAQAAAGRLRGEARTQGVAIPARLAAAGPWAGRLTAVAKGTAAVLASGLVLAAARAALRVFAPGRTAADVVAAVRDHLAGLTGAATAEQLGGALTAAQNAGRLAAIEAAAAEPTLHASEVLDKATCEPCRQIDGHLYADLAEARAAYANGGYTGCLGGLRCRGIIFATWE
jgi:hypothetical protein